MGATVYDLLHRKYLRDFETLVRKRDLPQASEKLWGAAAELVKVIAERRRWKHHGHRDLLVAMDRLEKETGDAELGRLFGAAQALHANFYENFMSSQVFHHRVSEAKTLIQKLQQFNGNKRRVGE